MFGVITLLVCWSFARQACAEEIVLCDLGVPKELAQANASFSVIYRLETGDSGEVQSSQGPELISS
jgi:hypothetical protein